MKKLSLYFAFAICISISILQMTNAVYAQSPDISSGLNWLNSNQSASGSWDSANSIVDIVPATSAVLESLAILNNTANPNYVNGTTWLTVQHISVTRYLAKRLSIFPTSSADRDSILLYMDELTRAWGGYDDFTVNNLDTALTLQALKAANYSDYAVLHFAISFITTNQNDDGGWGFRPASGGQDADPSNAYVTAMVLRTLAVHRAQFAVQSNIDRAKAYLLTKQNADGGFGSSPSTIYETALSLLSLIESGQADILPLQNGINYLTSSQLPNGSWNDDPYSTALALQALAAARPNLTVSSISLSKTMPQENESVTITANVRNSGLESASGIVVRFFLGDPSAGGTQIGTDQIIPSLAVNATAQSAITASFTGIGNKTIFAVVDPDNLVAETSESDNRSSARVWVATGPDLAVFSEDLKPSTYIPASGTAFTLSYAVRNLGETASGGFDLALYDGPSAGGGQGSGTLLQTVHISGLNGMEVRTGSIGVTLTGDGPHTLYLNADPGTLISELSESNNTASVTVTVGGVQSAADLAAGMIQLAPSRPSAGEAVAISASVRNQGMAQANDFSVEIYDGSPEAGGVLIHSQAISLAAGGEQAVIANWIVPSGIHDIFTVIDRPNGIIESDETNNRASARVMTDMKDIALDSTDLVFTPPHPVNGDSVVLSITAHNRGIRDTGPFTLALYDGDPAAGGVLIQTYPISNIPGDGKTTFSYTFTAIPWTYRFYAVADTENVVAEMYEENNLAIRSLRIKAPGEVLGPDLVPVKIDLSDMITDSETLAVGGAATVTVKNKGDDKITASFNVTVFEDMDNDGKFTAGLDTVLGTAANTAVLWPEGVNTVAVTLTGTVKFLHSPLHAFVDSGDVLREQNEDNNLLASCRDCEVVPSHPIQPVQKWFAGMQLLQPAIVTPLTDTNGDGKVNEEDIPAIVVTEYRGFNAPADSMWNGTLRALRGDNGAALFSVYDTVHPIRYNGTPLAAGDIDGDGSPEILVQTNCMSGLDICSISAHDRNGNLKWNNRDKVVAWMNANPGKSNNMGPMEPYTSPIIADMDHDGTPEIVMGLTVMNSADGSIRWALDPQAINHERSRFSTVADIDLDGKPEIINGGRAVSSDGVIKWTFTVGGTKAIGNFDDDLYPEIVVVKYSSGYFNVYLLDHNGMVKWGPVNTRSLDPGEPSINFTSNRRPVIADFDGDGEQEIGVQGANKYFVLDRNGALKKSYDLGSPILEETIATVFDLNGDNVPEVLIYANPQFRIFDGKSGTLLYSESLATASMAEIEHNVIVADVDGDGHAEIVVASRYGVKVYRSGNTGSNDWVNGRKVWNQSDYHVTNVNDDGSVPQYESPSWLMNNTFRAQARVNVGPNPYLTPNITASYIRTVQYGTSVNLTVRIGNGGAASAPAGIPVVFYSGTPGSGAVIGTAATTRALNPGDYVDVDYMWSDAPMGLQQISASVNDCSGGSDCSSRLAECSYADNQATGSFILGSNLPDLTAGPGDIALPSAPYTEGSLIPVAVTVRNLGPASAANVTVRLFSGNPAAGGLAIGDDQIIPTLNGNSSTTVTFNFDTLGWSGTNVLYLSVDPDNSVAEDNENNNVTSFTLTVSSPSLPNLEISASDIQTSPATLLQGDSITVAAVIKNRGAAAGTIPVRFYLGDPAAGGTIVSNQFVYPMLALGESASVQAVIPTTGISEQQHLYVVIDPENTITESNEDDNSALKAVFIQPAEITLSLSIDESQYQANSDVNVSLQVNNYNATAWSGTGDVYINDAAGNRVTKVSSFTVADLARDIFPGWSYRLPAQITAARNMKNKLASLMIDFPQAFATLGVSGKTVDQNSIRVLEIDQNGNMIEEKQARSNFTSASTALVTWLVNGTTTSGATRYFEIYFDSIDNGPKQASANTKIPVTGGLIAYGDDTGNIYTLENNRDGSFGAAVMVDNIGVEARGLALDDYNGDGYVDLLAGTGPANKIYYFQNKADGSNTFLPKIAIAAEASNVGMTAGDFNKDGNIDIVASGYANSTFSIYKGNGDGTFTRTALAVPTGSSGLRGKASADFNRDGNLDIVVAYVPFGVLNLYKGNGNGTFMTPIEIGRFGNDYFPADPYGVAAADFNEDGKIDIVAHGGFGKGVRFFSGNGDGTFLSQGFINSVPIVNPTAFAAGDFNNDGHYDLMAVNYSDKQVLFFPGKGNGTFGPNVTVATTTNATLGISSSPASAEVPAILGGPEVVSPQRFAISWNTGSTLSGAYQVNAVLSEETRPLLESKANFTIIPDTRMSATVFTDKISYNPNASTAMTATITSQSENYVFENLTARVAVKRDAASDLFFETKSIASLMPGATFTFKSYWNTGINAPGAYPVILEVRDAAGTVLATGMQNLVISSVVKPSTALKGSISVNRQSILTGEPVAAAYTVANSGNVDLSNVALTIRTVHVKNQTVYGTMAETVNLPLSTSVTATRQIDTASYAAMDYLVVLQAAIDGGPEETIAGSYFRVEGAPTVPALAAPADGSDVQTLLPVLTVTNASDANDDRLTYEFQVYADSSMTTLVASAGGIAQGAGTTSWQVPADLTENSTYFWRSRAYDGKLYGDWMSIDTAQDRPASFRVNVLNDPPTAPTIANPADNAEVPSPRPVLTVNNSSDPDSGNLTYNYQVALDALFTEIVASTTGVSSGPGATSWQVQAGLSENTWYYWRAQADDWLDAGPWSGGTRFFVNSLNEAPTVPAILAPADNSTITNQNVDVVLQNSIDVDSSIVSYYFEVDTVPTFDSGSLIRSGIIPAGPGTTNWQAVGLMDNTRYYARAMANDGSTGSGWTDPAVKFFVNTANDAPTTPAIANPSIGAGVKVTTPTLTVQNASDLDWDTLTYEFMVCSDAAFTACVDGAAGIVETTGTASWTVTAVLTENQTYYWRARAFDGSLSSGWAEGWFVVNTVNDAPDAPTILLPSDGSSIDTATPTLVVGNAFDPDHDPLTYDFEVYSGTTLVWSATGVQEGAGGNTAVFLPTELNDNTVYQWQSRAYDGDRYGAWTSKAAFTVHLPRTGITVHIAIEPETLNQKSSGNWIMAEIELPHGYNAADVDIASIRLEGSVPAVARPYEQKKRHHDHGCDADRREHDHGEIKVKFPRNAVIDLLPAGNHVPVHITGTVAGITFEGVDVIKVIH